MSTKENGKKNRKSTYDVYVGHLPTDIHEDKIHEVFSQYGEVSDILCRYKVNGEFGYAIVKFKHQKDVDKILHEINTVYVDGYEMEVKHGKRSNNNNNNNEYDNGFVPPLKTVSFSEPKLNAYQVGNVICIDPNIPVQDSVYVPFGNNEKNGQQLPVMIEVMCTSVEDAVTFYGCPVFRCEELRNLSIKLNSICPNVTRILRKPGLRKIYGALYSEDMSWYRCSVVQCTVPSKPGMCIVHYIDYGNVDEVSYTNLVDLPEPIKKIPPFAVRCILSNLTCNPNSHCDVSYLHHLVNQRMSLCALSFWGVPEYHVLKCSCNGIDVISELVRNGFAVYKSQRASSKSPPGKPEKSCLKSQDNHKSKKSSKSKNSQKSACNGVGKHANVENKPVDIGKSNKLNTNDNAQNGSASDFVPKKIIKRGSTIDNLEVPHLSGNKIKESVNQLLKVDCVISNLKLVNNIRDLVSPSSDDNLINNAVQFLLSGLDMNISEEDKNKVETAYKKYKLTLTDLKNCTDQGLLPNLKQQKEDQRNELCNELNSFLQNFDKSLFEKRKTIQKMITNLESNSTAWMNVYLTSQPDSIEDLLEKYNKEKEKRWNIIQKARENTNNKHKNFLEFLNDFQKEFSLNLTEKSGDSSTLDNAEGKKGSWDVKFQESLHELGHALEEELKTCNVYTGKSCISVIQCILERLDIPKERIDTECELYEKYRLLYDDLNYCSNLSSVFSDLADAQNRIKNLLSDYSKCPEIDKKKVLSELHGTLLIEDGFLESVAKAASQHFPELIMEHPELNLAEYQKNNCLLKHSWVQDYFPHFEVCSRVEPSYLSHLVDEPVVVKEFRVHDEAEKISLIKKGIVWNEIKSNFLVKVKAFFHKDEKTVCAIIPSVWDPFYDNPLSIPVDTKVACQVLQQVLIGLKDIHSRGMAHGAVHPLAILHKGGEILLDFNYDIRFIKDKLNIKGLNFQVPSGEDMCKSADMYGFGCLVLWVLFPNLLFTSNEEGVPNLSAFQSIIEEFLSAKDFVALSALLNANPDLRPSSAKLLSSGFLKDLRIIPETTL